MFGLWQLAWERRKLCRERLREAAREHSKSQDREFYISGRYMHDATTGRIIGQARSPRRRTSKAQWDMSERGSEKSDRKVYIDYPFAQGRTNYVRGKYVYNGHTDERIGHARPASSHSRKPKYVRVDKPGPSPVDRPSHSQFERIRASQFERPGPSQFERIRSPQLERPSTLQLQRVRSPQLERQSRSRSGRPSSSRSVRPDCPEDDDPALFPGPES